MGNFLDKLFNGPPFGPKCVPDCTNAPRGSTCYKGKCVPECPMYSKFVNGTCVCQSGLKYSSVNIPNNPPPPKDGNVTKNLFGLAKPNLVFASAFNSSTLLAICYLPRI